MKVQKGQTYINHFNGIKLTVMQVHKWPSRTQQWLFDVICEDTGKLYHFNQGTLSKMYVLENELDTFRQNLQSTELSDAQISEMKTEYMTAPMRIHRTNCLDATGRNAFDDKSEYKVYRHFFSVKACYILCENGLIFKIYPDHEKSQAVIKLYARCTTEWFADTVRMIQTVDKLTF